MCGLILEPAAAFLHQLKVGPEIATFDAARLTASIGSKDLAHHDRGPPPVRKSLVSQIDIMRSATDEDR
jgi:hypothetical protein